MKTTYFLFLFIFQAHVFFAQKSDCSGLYRGVRQIQSYFPTFDLNDNTFKLKADVRLSAIDGDGNLLAKVKDLGYTKLLISENSECRDFATVKSFSVAYKNALLVELSAGNADIQASIGQNEYQKAYDQTTKALRLIKGYQILVPSDTAFVQSVANLQKIRDEIDITLAEIRTAATMQANATMSRKATLTDLMEIFIIELKSKMTAETVR